MTLHIDYSGEKIGRVLIIEALPRLKWNCLCDCGNYFVSSSQSFKRGETFECNPCRFERRRGVDLTGRKFGRWSVKERKIDSNGKTKWSVLCDCGNTGLVSTSSLGKKGRSMSCGCLGRKQKSKRANSTLYPPEHLTSVTDLYCIRARILQGCYNPNNVAYNKYGAIGVTVCDLWRNSAKDFHDWCLKNKWKKGDVVHLKRGKTVFSPENCAILHPSESQREQLAKRITIDGENLNVYEWSEISGIPRHTILDRLCKGYSEYEAVFCKRHKNSGKKSWPDEKIKALYESGLSMSDIGRNLGINYQSISKRLKAMGVEIDKNGTSRRKYPLKACNTCNTEFHPNNSRAKFCLECREKKQKVTI